MNREIKFRAWLPAIKQMTYEHTIEELMAWGSGKGVEGKTATWLQFTGLSDKNGTEIYEGDIVTSDQYPFQDEGKYNYHGIVEWGNEHAAFFLTKALVNGNKRGISDGISETLMDYDMSEFEVLGNIHQHPELLRSETNG